MGINETRFRLIPVADEGISYFVLGMIAFQYDSAPREGGFTAWFFCVKPDGRPLMLRESYGWYAGSADASMPPLSECLGFASQALLTDEEADACMARLRVTFDREASVPIAASLGVNPFSQEPFDDRP